MARMGVSDVTWSRHGYGDTAPQPFSMTNMGLKSSSAKRRERVRRTAILRSKRATEDLLLRLQYDESAGSKPPGLHLPFYVPATCHGWPDAIAMSFDAAYFGEARNDEDTQAYQLDDYAETLAAVNVGITSSLLDYLAPDSGSTACVGVGNDMVPAENMQASMLDTESENDTDSEHGPFLASTERIQASRLDDENDLSSASDEENQASMLEVESDNAIDPEILGWLGHFETDSASDTSENNSNSPGNANDIDANRRSEWQEFVVELRKGLDEYHEKNKRCRDESLDLAQVDMQCHETGDDGKQPDLSGQCSADVRNGSSSSCLEEADRAIPTDAEEFAVADSEELEESSEPERVFCNIADLPEQEKNRDPLRHAKIMYQGKGGLGAGEVVNIRVDESGFRLYIVEFLNGYRDHLTADEVSEMQVHNSCYEKVVQEFDEEGEIVTRPEFVNIGSQLRQWYTC